MIRCKLLGIKLSLLFLLTALGAAVVHAAPVGQDTNKLTDLTKPIMVLADQPQVILKLKANRSTGYQWILKSYDHDLIEPISSVYQANKNPQLVGSPATSLWTFKVKPVAFVVPQTTQITLIYARPWSLEQADQKTVTVVMQPTIKQSTQKNLVKTHD